MFIGEIRYQDPGTRTYLGSPSIVRLENRDLIVTHDYFGPGCPRNREDEEHLTSVYRSSDDGETWTEVTHIANAFWSSLFRHDGATYLLGVSQHYGSIVIRRSEDGGNTWTHPKDETTGLLLRGGAFREPPNYHCAPVPVLLHQGRLYRAFEDCTPCQWPAGFQSFVISADAGANLLGADSWRVSNKLAFDPAWVPSAWGEADHAGWLEGNLVEDGGGQLWNILRFNAKIPGAAMGERWDTACRVKVEEQGALESFDPETGFLDCPGGHSKFTIRFDPVSGRYWTLSNGHLDQTRPTRRAVLSLYDSEDLWTWRHVAVALRDESGLSPEDSFRLTGFQYVDWQFDGEDLIAAVRTAYGGAHNYHDANRVNFLRIPDFRWGGVPERGERDIRDPRT